MAAAGGSIGALLGMKVFHHKTLHKGRSRFFRHLFKTAESVCGAAALPAAELKSL